MIFSRLQPSPACQPPLLACKVAHRLQHLSAAICALPPVSGPRPFARFKSRSQWEREAPLPVKDADCPPPSMSEGPEAGSASGSVVVAHCGDLRTYSAGDGKLIGSMGECSRSSPSVRLKCRIAPFVPTRTCATPVYCAVSHRGIAVQSIQPHCACLALCDREPLLSGPQSRPERVTMVDASSSIPVVPAPTDRPLSSLCQWTALRAPCPVALQISGSTSGRAQPSMP